MKKEVWWLRTDVVARIVGPALGGMLILGALLPDPRIGSLLGAVIGVMAGVTYNRALTKSR
ncbi:MAG TPA: hypothetical protein VF414_03500 [Thermoanaerobaculia bacterium]